MDVRDYISYTDGRCENLAERTDIDVVGFARSIPENPGLSISLIVITALIGLIMFFTGVSAICYYTNRGKLKNYLPLLTSISLFFSIGFIVILSLTQNNSTNRYSLIVTCVVTVLLIITLVCACKLHKKDKEYKNY